MRKKITLIISVLFVFLSVSISASFYQNPVYILSGKNSLVLSFDTDESFYYNTGFYWRQREGNLIGELGYTTDSSYATGTINYRLIDVSKLYSVNFKLRVLPADAKALVIDVGGLMRILDKLNMSFSAYDVMFYNEKSERLAPKFQVIFDYVFNVFGMNFEILSFGADVLRFGLGVSLNNLDSLKTLVVSYSPLYDLRSAKLSNALNFNGTFAMSNYFFEISGYYNFETIDNIPELSKTFGVKISVGFNM
ncbi:hypothetical protein MNL76_08095 [Fervidobacterium riparium]|uniref:Outer membrane protein beta-barrel domain-containing protein n=1 Tax=Fervidobacterium gondwanense DSM 13020 TaxID=1121883 RepID=A0A1M7T8T4_FERGO|nr:hypothetical protein [Fervidobacterium gondwanense]UXF01324.1 hypothetical protein IB67_07190 [Fervidobacterium riparium]SHN67135.1 hypothetical protein SAMN02745226_01725 [Fervidobacterium gondwanense DSM 13020]